MCLDEPPKTSLIATAARHPSLAAKEKRSYVSRKTIQSRSETCSYQHSAKKIPHFLGFILCLCLLLHRPASWLSSSESQNRVWEKIEIAAKPAQNQALQPPELQQTKVDLPYNFASGSSVYCNGDPVNGLDPDGRCVEGGVKGYAMGSFAEYDNTAQAVGGFVGTGLSYITPGLGEYALTRDIAGSAWHGLQAADDMYNSGLNWRNGTQLGLSAVGVGAGAFSTLAPTKAAVEASTSIEEGAVSSFPAAYQGGPGAMWSGEVFEQNLSITQGSRITENNNLLPSTAGRSNDFIVIGRQIDTAVAANWEGHKVLGINNWTLEMNDSFIDTGIKNRQSFYIASPINYHTLWNPVRNGMTVFGRELGQIYKAGYQKIGDYLHPPQ